MIENTFLILPRVKDEKRIWAQGIKTWEDFIAAEKVEGMSDLRKAYCDRQLLKARRALYSGDTSYFLGVLPLSEMWRLYGSFKEEAVFLDIETCSTDNIRVVGLFDGVDYNVMVRNIDVIKLKKYLSQFKMIVTFNGNVHDIPRMNKYYENLLPKVICVDLRTICARLGIKGGLKDVEKQLGVKRPEYLVPNCSVASLWRTYMASGEERYLETLIEYNEYDTVNLKRIADILIKKLIEKTLYTTAKC